MILIIEGLDDKIVKLSLFNSETISSHSFEAEKNLSERLSREIEKFLTKQKINQDQIRKVAVTVGPGHFSRIRTCVATANALAYGWGAQIIGLPLGWSHKNLAEVSQIPVKPLYDKPPNITKSNPRLTKFAKRLR